MGRPRKTEPQGVAEAAPAPAPAGPRSVLAASWDPSDPSINFNNDRPAYAAPKAEPHGKAVPFETFYGEMKQQREGQVGAARPMFGSHKE